MEVQGVDHNQGPLSGSSVWVQATASASEITRPRGLLCTVDGSITIEDENATELADMPVAAGTVYPLMPTKVTAITDATVWLLY